MERKIGEIFEYNGEWYQCVIGWRCKDCAFNEERKCYTFTDNNDPIGDCSAERRTDKYSVIFKKLEKVGEPYDDCGTILQRFRIYTNVTNADTKGLELHIYSNNTIGIEIKRNQEDMEEKKLNLKPFNLKAAKSGKPVCTRDGRKARIICYDVRMTYKGVCYPIVAAVENGDGEETVCSYNEKGKVLVEDDFEYHEDLMMLPEKKEGWVNVYKGGLLDTKSYPTKKEAFDKTCPEGYIDTIKISWEE